MMENLRIIANSLVLKILFVIIILSFLLTSVSSYLIDNSNHYAVKINDITINQIQLQQVFQ
ncbi:MAG: SurA N-terminal domain-containing protein, partial [Arsenophonus sp. ET-DL12-MAG3]